MALAKPNDTIEIDVAIIGGGIAGLTLAAALAKQTGIKAVVFEQSHEASFGEGTGGAIGLYANGLQVLWDIGEDLLESVCNQGMPYERRRWLRHDGTEFATADETLLMPSPREDKRLQPIGIRRWKFQKELLHYAKKLGVSVQFGKRLEKLDILERRTRLHFVNSEQCFDAKLVFGADGVKSRVREFLFPETEQPSYTGVTTLMAVSKSAYLGPNAPPKLRDGIHFISSVTSKFHACMYSLPNNETNVQIYLPMPENPESWGKLSPEAMKKEALAMEQKLRKDGWNPESVIRVGLRARPPLKKWCKGKVILLGDAAHPPVPYIGQGAMQAIEDAGVLSLLIQRFCPKTNNMVDFEGIDAKIRVPRCTERRADSWLYNLKYEWSIWGQVQLEGHLPIMKLGACYDYKKDVATVVANKSKL
ncbi:hypothetical protein BDR26DRAFT_874232 [Obelidium mucronatum]|nr:hypothetical protein BDR26DRAFT_874232 [Obelidium mucronatum]